MCLAVFAWKSVPGYRLIFAGNRDEFYLRPSRPARWWRHPPDILAGRDLRAGGTWLGISRSGRFGIITNFREMTDGKTSAPSRGRLIPEYLGSTAETQQFCDDLSSEMAEFSPFSFVFGDADDVHYVSNRAENESPIPPGLHGLSNHALNTPWPKLTRASQRLEKILADGNIDTSLLFEMLADRTPAEDDELPDTGLGIELERMLSSPFIAAPTYGTRCSTVLTVSDDGKVSFSERSFERDGSFAGAVSFEFELVV